MFYFQLKKIEIIITINNIINMINHQDSKNNKNKVYCVRNYINRKVNRKLNCSILENNKNKIYSGRKKRNYINRNLSKIKKENNNKKTYNDRKKRNHINRKRHKKSKTKLNYNILGNTSVVLYRKIKEFDIYEKWLSRYLDDDVEWYEHTYLVNSDTIDISNYDCDNYSVNFFEISPSYGVSFTLDKESVLNILPELKNVINSKISPISKKDNVEDLIKSTLKANKFWNFESKVNVIDYRVIDSNSKKVNEDTFLNEYVDDAYKTKVTMLYPEYDSQEVIEDIFLNEYVDEYKRIYKLIICLSSDNDDPNVGSDEIFDIHYGNYRRKIYPTCIEGNSVCFDTDFIHKKNIFNDKNITKIEVLLSLGEFHQKSSYDSKYYSIEDNYLEDKKYENYLEQKIRKRLFCSNRGSKIYLSYDIIKIIYSYLQINFDHKYFYKNESFNFNFIKNTLLRGKDGLYYIMLKDEKKIIEYTYENYYKLLN